MKYCYSCRTEKPFSSFYKNKKNKDGWASQCATCFKTYFIDYRKLNADKIREQQKTYCVINAEKQRTKTRDWVKENPLRKKESDASYRSNNVTKIKEYQREKRLANKDAINEKKRIHRKENPEYYKLKGREYRQRNKGAVLADRAFRKAKKRQATPSWLTKEQRKQMRDVYISAANLTACMGVCYHVDHIIPIVSDLVCGLHVPWNLQVLEADKNIAKSNKLTEG